MRSPMRCDAVISHTLSTCVCRLQLQPVVVSHVLRCLALSWYPGPGHRPVNAASLSMVPEPGIDYRQPSDCQNCRYLHSSTSSRPTSSSTGVLVVAVSRIYTAVRRRCDCCEFGADYKCPDSTQLNSTAAPHVAGLRRRAAPHGALRCLALRCVAPDPM